MRLEVTRSLLLLIGKLWLPISTTTGSIVPLLKVNTTKLFFSSSVLASALIQICGRLKFSSGSLNYSHALSWTSTGDLRGFLFIGSKDDEGSKDGRLLLLLSFTTIKPYAECLTTLPRVELLPYFFCDEIRLTLGTLSTSFILTLNGPPRLFCNRSLLPSINIRLLVALVLLVTSLMMPRDEGLTCSSC